MNMPFVILNPPTYYIWVLYGSFVASCVYSIMVQYKHQNRLAKLQVLVSVLLIGAFAYHSKWISMGVVLIPLAGGVFFWILSFLQGKTNIPLLTFMEFGSVVSALVNTNDMILHDSRQFRDDKEGLYSLCIFGLCGFDLDYNEKFPILVLRLFHDKKTPVHIFEVSGGGTDQELCSLIQRLHDAFGEALSITWSIESTNHVEKVEGPYNVVMAALGGDSQTVFG